MPDKTLARIARTVTTKRGKIILDEETIGFLYAKAKGKPALYIVDSDHDFMRLDGKMAGRGKPILNAPSLYESYPALLNVIDPQEYKKLTSRK